MSAAIANSHRTSRIWAPPSTPPRRLRPRGMRSPMSMPSSTRCWRNSRPWRQMAPGRPFRAQAAVDRSGAAQGDHGDLVRRVLRHAVARHRPALRHPVRHALHPVRPLDPAWPVAPAAQPLDPGLAAGLRRYSRPQRRHHRQPVLSVRRRLASGAASMAARRSRASRSISRSTSTASRWRSTSRRRISMTARASSRCCISLPAAASREQPWVISAIGASGCPRPARRLALPSNPAPAVTAEPSFRRVFAGSSTSFSAGTAESLSLLIPYPRAGHAALLNVVHWLERRRDREPLAGPNDVVATAGFAAAQGDDPPRPADPTLSCRPPTDRIEGGRP